MSTFTSSIRTNITDFFNKGQKRSIVAKRNIAGSLIIRGVSIAINLLLVPLTINFINPTQYGIWLTLSSIIAWVSFFDIGFGHGLRNRFAEAIAVGNLELAKKYVSTTYAILAIIFSALFLMFVIGNFFLDWSKVLNAPSGMTSELSILALIVFGFFCLQMVLRIIRTILLADQRPALASTIDMLGQLLALIFIFFLTRSTEGSLIKLGLALGLAQIIVLIIATLMFFNRRYRLFAPSFKNIDFLKAKDIFNLGSKFFFIQVSVIIIFQTNNIVITQLFGPEQVTVYNIAYKYFFSVAMVFNIILTPFWSSFTDAFSRRDFIWMRNVVKKLSNIWILIIPVVLIMLISSTYVYRVWIGGAVVIPLSISFLLAFYVILYTRYNLFIYLINGIGKIHLQLYIDICISIIYIPLAVYSGKWLGLEGVISANIIVLIIHAIIGQIQIKKLMVGNAKGIWNK